MLHSFIIWSSSLLVDSAFLYFFFTLSDAPHPFPLMVRRVSPTFLAYHNCSVYCMISMHSYRDRRFHRELGRFPGFCCCV